MAKRMETIALNMRVLPPKGKILVGVSGGPDSLCLLGLLHAELPRSLEELVVAHFNHKLRPEADLEVARVSEIARKLNLSFTTASSDVSTYAYTDHLSIEQAARNLRYRFLFEQARQCNAAAVVVGHTADDQIETMLMHLIQGSGLNGLKGMLPVTILPEFDNRIPLVRPILHLWRHETEAYCLAHDLQPIYDSSNEDLNYLRNRLRHALIPKLQEMNPRVKTALWRTVEILQSDFVALQEVVDAIWEDCVVATGAGWVAFDQAKISRVSPGLRANLLKRAAGLLRPNVRDTGFIALARADAFVVLPQAGQIDLADGLYLFHEAGKVYLAAYESDLPSNQWPQVVEQVSLPIGRVELGSGWIMVVDEMNLDRESDRLEAMANSDPYSACLDVGTLSTGLILRNRRRGDRFQPLGMTEGSVKLSDFFINVKLPVRARDKWPLVCMGDSIVWVPGFRLAHPFRITEASVKVLRLILFYQGE